MTTSSFRNYQTTSFCNLNGKWPSRLLLATYIIFIALLLGADNTKLTNNFFYLFLMLPAMILVARRQLRPTRACLLLGGYLLYVALSSFWNNADPGDSAKHLKYVVYILAFAAITQQVMAQPERLKWIAAWGLLISLVVEAHSLYTMINVIGLDNWLHNFPRLAQINGPLNAVYLGLAIGLFGFILISSQVRTPWLASLLICGLILMTIPLQSRTPILALLLAHSYYLFRLRAFSALACWILMLAAGVFALILMVDRFTVEFYRADIWLGVAGTMSEHCSILIGCGNRFEFNISAQGIYFYNPHSIWLSQFFYGGAIGIVFLLVVFGSIIQGKHQLPDYSLPLFTYSFIACVPIGHSLLTHPDFLWLLTWFPLALSGMLFRSADSINQAKQHHEADANTPVPV